MKTILIIPCFLLFSSIVFSQTKEDEKRVLAVLQKMHDAWVEHDYSYSKYDVFDDSAVLINPVGMVWKTKSEITNGLQFLGEVRFRYLTIIKDTVLSIRFLAPTVALVTANSIHEINEDFMMPDGSKGGTKGEISEGIYSYTFTNKDGKWRITSMHITHAMLQGQK